MSVGALISLILGAIYFFVRKFLTKGVAITFQFSIVSSLIAFSIVVVGMFFSSIAYFYNLLNDFSHSVSATIPSCVQQLISCSGLSAPINLFFNELFAIIVSVVVFRLSFFFLWIYRLIANEIWKLGVLLGL